MYIIIIIKLCILLHIYYIYMFIDEGGTSTYQEKS